MRSFYRRSSKAQKERTPQEAQEYFKDRMLNYLSARKCEKEVRDYLARIGCPQDLHDTLIGFALEYHFLDDEEYTRCFIRDSLRIKHRSIRRIRYDLGGKGISRELADQILEEEEADDLEAACWHLNRRLSHPAQPQEIEKARAYLQSIGFSYDVILRAIDKSTE